MNYKITYSDDYLAHHGILGQKWGVRRFRNEDGTLTDAGKKRYGQSLKERFSRKKQASGSSESGEKKSRLSDKQKSILKKVAVGAAVAVGVGATAYAVKKYKNRLLNDLSDFGGKEAINGIKGAYGQQLVEDVRKAEIGRAFQSNVVFNNHIDKGMYDDETGFDFARSRANIANATLSPYTFPRGYDIKRKEAAAEERAKFLNKYEKSHPVLYDDPFWGKKVDPHFSTYRYDDAKKYGEIPELESMIRRSGQIDLENYNKKRKR